MTATLISPSGAVLLHRGRRSTTPAEQAEAKAVRVWFRKECRQEENRRFLKHRNVRAFVRALAVSLNPGLAPEGAAAGAGLYRIAPEDWQSKAARMGLGDTGPESQDLVAVETLRELGVLTLLEGGDVWSVLGQAARYWPALPAPPGADGRFAPPATEYEIFCMRYKEYGGTVSELAGALSFGRGGPASNEPEA